MQTHKLVFGNLRDARTGKPVSLDVPNDLVYEGHILVVRELARQSAQETLARIRRESEPE